MFHIRRLQLPNGRWAWALYHRHKLVMLASSVREFPAWPRATRVYDVVFRPEIRWSEPIDISWDGKGLFTQMCISLPDAK